MPGATAAVGGDTAASVDFSRGLSDRLPLVVGFVLALPFVLVLWSFRSVVVAATAIVLNLLSVGAAYGLMVLVFQHTWAEGLLDFRSTGTIVAWLPMFLFVVLFGLSMDYHVFVVSRICELALGGMPTPEAVRQGTIGSAGAVTSAAVVMVAVFSIFATLSGVEFKQLGVGLAAAILLDATLVRGGASAGRDDAAGPVEPVGAGGAAAAGAAGAAGRGAGARLRSPAGARCRGRRPRDGPLSDVAHAGQPTGVRARPPTGRPQEIRCPQMALGRFRPAGGVGSVVTGAAAGAGRSERSSP